MVARVQARSRLNDVAEGSTLLFTLASVAEELGGVEIRLAGIRDSFAFDSVSGLDLDERVAELPPGFTPRLPAVSASGNVLTVSRISTDAIQVLPAGTVVGRSDDAKALYRTSVAMTFGIGIEVVGQIKVVAMSPGEAGNCNSGQINKTVSVPSWVRSVISSAPLSNGQASETDAQLRRRALLWLSSLARCQPAAMEYAALSFIGSDRTRFRYVRLYEDPTRPGYSEIIVDDGSALAGTVRPGRLVSGTIPNGGIGLLWHEAPATAPIDRLTVLRGGVLTTIRAQVGNVVNFVSIPERGAIHIVKTSVFQAGDYWTIQNYNVFVGPPAELQRIIEGQTGDPSNPGFRALGTRARVTGPTTQDVALDLHIVPIQGVDLEALSAVIQNDAIRFIATLNPGEPLLIARLVDRLMDNASLKNVHVYRGGSDPVEKASDVYPSTSRHVLRSRVGLLNIVPAPEV